MKGVHRTLFWLFAFATVAIAPNAVADLPAPQGAVVDGWQLSLTASPGPYSQGADIPLHLSVKNVSERSRILAAPSAPCVFHVLVKRADGTMLTRHPAGCYNFYNTSDRSVSPNGSFNIELSLGQYVTLRDPGDYLVSEVGILDEDSNRKPESVPVQSNWVEISIAR